MFDIQIQKWYHYHSIEFRQYIKHRKNEISVQKNYPWSGFFEVNIAEADFTHI